MVPNGASEEVTYGLRLNTANYKLLPLCRSILVIFDEVKQPHFDGILHLDREIERLNVLIFRTKDEASLSAPITFDSIRSQSLPLARSDVETAGDAIIRVPLRTAIIFILNLQRREEAAFPSLSLGSSNDETMADGYVPKIMRRAVEEGFNNVYAIGEVLWFIEREEQGRPIDIAEFDFWSALWR